MDLVSKFLFVFLLIVISHIIPISAQSIKQYIVLFNSTPSAEVQDAIANLLDIHTTYSTPPHLQGFSAILDADHICSLSESYPDILIEPVTTARASAIVGRLDGPWGLQRISSADTVYGNPDGLNYTYWFDNSHNLGEGIDIYIIDTGINTEHFAFGGRAANLYPSGSDAADDSNGHGTHVAGIAGAQFYGVASSANIIGVQTLGADGTGPSNDTLAGIEWAINRHVSRVNASGAGQDASFVGSVINLSLSFSTNSTEGPSQALYRAIRAATEAGIHVVGIAGNDMHSNACNTAPGNAGGSSGPAIIAGAIDQFNEIAFFSNTGPCVDLYAPGEEVISTWISNTTATNALSGTSQAAPHIAGIVAYLAANNASSAQDPTAIKNYLQSTALTGIVDGSTMQGDLGLLVNNGVLGPS